MPGSAPASSGTPAARFADAEPSGALAPPAAGTFSGPSVQAPVSFAAPEPCSTSTASASSGASPAPAATPRADTSAPLGTPPAPLALPAPPPADSLTPAPFTSADAPGTPVAADSAPTPVPEHLAPAPEHPAPAPVAAPAPATPTHSAPTPVPEHPAPTPAPGPTPATTTDPAPTPVQNSDPAPTPTQNPDSALAPTPTQNPDPPLAPPATPPSTPTSNPDPAPNPAPNPDPDPAPAPAPTPTPPNPWHRYDPWAPRTPAPLQQNGAPTPTSAPTHPRIRPRTLLASALALTLLAGGVGGVVGAYIERGGPGGDVVLPQAREEGAGRGAGTVAGIAARALPSVVTLRVSGDDVSGTGTGVVLDGRGDILTNNHVVRAGGGGGAISVRFSGGQTVKGDVVGRDVGYDLAVVRVHGVRGLRAMPLGNSDNVRVGDPVVAIGAPFGLDNTVTAGIVSAKERPVTTGGDASDGSGVSYLDALQTDAPINPGNSGGPLLDARGLLVGVNSAIRSADEQDGAGEGSAQSGSVGLGFAIPVNQAKRVAEELINHGKATHPVIGVTLDLDYAGDGARVATPKAGLRAGDVITRVDGQPVHSGDELVVRTRAHRPGDHLRLTLRRGGQDMTLSLVLGSATGD
ncbi:S1C family serine protease [Streptomyces sp. YS-B37]|uniref:S1C family serine protease n=1 Tax=Streptomyces sp. YS-B37 TaxID=3407669 RepID=UPI003B50C0EB